MLFSHGYFSKSKGKPESSQARSFSPREKKKLIQIFVLSYYFSRAATMKSHRLGDVKQQKFVLL